MTLRFASLASGSRGNCLVVEKGSTRILLDCGLPPDETERRLARLGVCASTIATVVVTHEHNDHAAHVYAFALRHGVPVYLTRGTYAALADEGRVDGRVATRFIRAGASFAVDGIEMRPFAVPHDAREPAHIVFSDGAFRLGVVTDIGAPSESVQAALSGCHALVVEANHDLDLLWAGDYPRWLKDRIAGPLGHLDNAGCAQLLAGLDRSKLQHVVCAHLSQKNNRPELAQATVAAALGCEPRWVGVATQDEGFGWRELG